jgi:diguanylate cyclase (GGDEF)-like protein
MGTDRGKEDSLLDGLLEVQRAIVAQRALHEVLDVIVGCAQRLIRADVVVLRLRDPSQPGRTSVVASQGASHALLARAPRGEGGDVGAQARAKGELVAQEGGESELSPWEWVAEGLRVGMAAPVRENGEVAGSLGVASRDPRRRFSQDDRRALGSLAEHATLALNQARALDDLAHQVFHDPLTGLANRALFIDRAKHALARVERTGLPVGVLVIDLDEFHAINDSIGHRLGDALLSEVGARLSGELRPTDTLARLGSDEFAVLLEDIHGREDAAQAAERLLEALTTPFDLGDRRVFLTASIGVAAGVGDPETLLRNADLAMYRAKAQGRGRCVIFEEGMHRAVVERLELDGELRRGIENDELELAYQPIIDMKTGEVSGLEALVRWRHPTRGLLPPARFIPMSEASGRIREVGRWVLRAACHQGALWRAKYPAMPGLRISVNLSGVQLRDPELVKDVAAVLEETQLEPDALTLEVTETVLMDDLDLASASRRLSELKRLGIEIAVDDFGVGHASLRYLKRLPLDFLKIARPFVDEIERPEPRPRMLQAILELSGIFGLRPVAEGIERPEQRERLLELGCRLGQGHLLARPLSAAAADAVLLRSGLLGSGPGASDQAISVRNDPN